ncbi:tRNA lysidine(34) synthetase TilS, partial [archaeon]
ATQCKQQGIAHVTHRLDWSVHGGKPEASRVQAAARAARYAVLQSMCLALRATHCFTAHTLDDQFETFLIRWGRASGVQGLAGMQPARVLPSGVVLCRPLLGFTKDELIATCRARGAMFVTDPSNANPLFDRVRARRALAWLRQPHAEPAPTAQTAPGSTPLTPATMASFMQQLQLLRSAVQMQGMLARACACLSRSCSQRVCAPRAGPHVQSQPFSVAPPCFTTRSAWSVCTYQHLRAAAAALLHCTCVWKVSYRFISVHAQRGEQRGRVRVIAALTANAMPLGNHTCSHETSAHVWSRQCTYATAIVARGKPGPGFCRRHSRRGKVT